MIESKAIEIGPDQITEAALNGIIENFILRDGTDYGWAEASHETKMEQVLRQIKKGDIKIVFDPESDSVTLMTARDWKDGHAKF